MVLSRTIEFARYLKMRGKTEKRKKSRHESSINLPGKQINDTIEPNWDGIKCFPHKPFKNQCVFSGAFLQN